MTRQKESRHPSIDSCIHYPKPAHNPVPFFYSISEGISMGVIAYVVMNLFAGKKEKITPVMYILAVLFILKYILM